MAHTPGPWEIETSICEGITFYQIVQAGVPRPKNIVDTANSEVAIIHDERDIDGSRWDEQGRIDTAFIVDACNAHDALLAERDRLKVANAELLAALKGVVAWAKKVRQLWYDEQDSKVDKNLCAMAGHLATYNAECSAVQAAIAKHGEQ